MATVIAKASKLNCNFYRGIPAHTNQQTLLCTTALRIAALRIAAALRAAAALRTAAVLCTAAVLRIAILCNAVLVLILLALREF